MTEIRTIRELDQQYQESRKKLLEEKAPILRAENEQYFEELRNLFGEEDQFTDESKGISITQFRTDDPIKEVLFLTMDFDGTKAKYAIYRWGLSSAFVVKPEHLRASRFEDEFDCAEKHNYSQEYCGGVRAIVAEIRERFQKDK